MEPDRQPAMGTPLLQLEVRGGETSTLAGTAALAALLCELREDHSRFARLAANSPGLRILLPATPAAPEEPDWLRAAEMIDEDAACPGERLFASSLATAAHWCHVDEMASAARSLSGALPAEDILAAKSLTREAILHGCTVVATAAERLPASRQVRLIGCERIGETEQS